MGGYGMFGGYGAGFGWLFMLLWGVLIVGGVVMLVKWLGGSSSNPSSSIRDRTALDILKERYARGELKREEFEQMKRDIEA
ncbi:MAG: SHOCT domain-containing protein [Thiobacillaceae bacterium]|jgi:putative membrane protein